MEREFDLIYNEKEYLVYYEITGNRIDITYIGDDVEDVTNDDPKRMKAAQDRAEELFEDEIDYEETREDYEANIYDDFADWR